MTFEDPSGRSLRYLAMDATGHPLRDPFGRALVSIDGNGPVVKSIFFGTAFLITPKGALLTSRHVVEPWRGDEDIRAILNLGVRPRVVQLLAFFPDLTSPIPVAVLRTSDQRSRMSPC